MTWTFDAPSGTYKDNFLSEDIRREAIADTQFMKFLRPEPGYGKGKGQSVTITRILQLPLAGRVSEIDRLPSGRPAIQTKSVTVSEWGFKIPMTEFEKNLTFFDLSNPFQAMLRDQMSLTTDKMAADALKTTLYKFTPLLAGSAFATNGVAPGTADKNLDIGDLRSIYDTMRVTLKVPTYRNGKYIGIVSTRAARGIKNDPEYKDWLAPQSADPMVNNYLKDVEGFSLYESNHVNALADLIGSSTVAGEAIFFGADAGFLAIVDNPELRAGLPDDLGRFREVGWVGTMEAGLTWETASLSRVIHVTSL